MMLLPVSMEGRIARGLLLLQWSFAVAASGGEAIAVTAGGKLAGSPGRNPGVQVYKGIPYARPPVGPLRWKPPQAPARWGDGEVRQANAFGHDCMQLPYPAASLYYQDPRPMSEDCLYLNVWTGAASASERRPVMVWIHGGAYTRGSGSIATYDGEHFASKGVVLVTLNYRIGIFGFLAHPELTKESEVHASGNYGLLDMVQALEWVKQNIAAFGGDPHRVTIFGESAGSSAVNYLQASPLARGLFHRVIGESGANFGGRTSPLQAGEKEGAKLGPSIAELRAKPAAELLKATGSFRPVVDSWFLTDDVSRVFAKGRQHDVPLLAGYNQDEGTTLAPWTGNAAFFKGMVQQRYGTYAEELLQLYPAGSDEEAAKSYYALFRDQSMGWQMRTWGRAMKSGKSPAYLYYFTRVPPGPEFKKYGSYHAAEIQYVFGNLSPRRAWEDTDRALSQTMSDYWVNFAATGDPNRKGVLPHWPKYDSRKDESMVFGERMEAQSGVNRKALDLLDRMAVTATTRN